MSTTVASNPLGSESVTKLMLKFSIPSIISMLVGALYNIVDQLFIGQAVGMLGNAATNVAFPLSTSCIALALLFGIGGAACFNLKMGAGEKEDAAYFDAASSLLDTILEEQSTDVDTVSGAPFSSNGIIHATEDALRKAEKSE